MDSNSKNGLLKLSLGYFVLWFVLLAVIASKLFLLRGMTAADLGELGLFGAVMLAVSYFGAWAIWRFSGKDQRTGEISYLAIMTVFFFVRTILLYREAFATT